jgi:hypothetical protein
MNCKKAQYGMQLQQDGELPDRWRSGLIKHLSHCKVCRDLQDQNAVIGGAFRELAAEISVRSASQVLITGVSRWERWRTPMAVAATIVLVMGFWSIPLVAGSATGSDSLIVTPHPNLIPSHPQTNADIPSPLGLSLWISAGYWTRVILTLLILSGLYFFFWTQRPEIRAKE